MVDAARALGPEAVCPACGTLFVPRPRQRTCSELCRWRAKDQARRLDPRRIAYVRANSLRYDAAHHGREFTNPWLRGAPVYDTALPGGLCTITIVPAPERPLEHRHLRHLHGALCRRVLRRDHDERPAFALRPSAWGCGWAVRWADDADAELGGRAFDVHLFGQERSLILGPTEQERAPSVFLRRGRRQLRVDAITPVVIRSMGGKTVRTAPEASHIASSLLALAARLGIGLSPDDLRLELVHRETAPEPVRILGKYGVLRGWTGHLILEGNAAARWLLLVSARVGLGGRTALGFGTVSVTEVEP